MDSTHATSIDCPNCGCVLERRRRTTLDRFSTLFAFSPRGRYGCTAGCGWQGLLPLIGRRPADVAPHGLSYRRRRILEPSRSGPL